MNRLRQSREEGGFALVAAIALLVLMTSLGAFLVDMVSTQNVTSTQDVQGARAFHAARAGVEWGLYSVLDPTNATVVAPVAAAWPNMPDCPAVAVLAIGGFTVTVGCVRFPAGAAGPSGPPVYLEAGATRSLIVYQLTATAVTTGLAVGAPGYAERQVSATVSKCRALDGAAPGFECP